MTSTIKVHLISQKFIYRLKYIRKQWKNRYENSEKHV